MGNGFCMCNNPTSSLNQQSQTSTISIHPHSHPHPQNNNNTTLPDSLNTTSPIKIITFDKANINKLPSLDIKIINKEPYSFEYNLLNEINKVRHNPRQYAQQLTEVMKYITCSGNAFFLSYPNYEKIILKGGKEVFMNVIQQLNYMEELPLLNWNEDIKISMKETMIPLTEDKIADLIITKRNEVKTKYDQCAFYYDFIDNPELSVIIMIVNDELFKHMRRDAILSGTYQHFSVGYIYDPIRKFVSLLSFA